jgi:hypothetical protein
MMVDRQKRDALIETINRFLDGTTTAFQFDEELDPFREKQTDPTVSKIAGILWYFYDDCKDHKVCLSKQAWQYFQRLILILQSDAHIISTSFKIGHITQLIAAISLLIFGYSIYYLGMGIQYFAIVLPFGLISIILSHFRKQREENLEHNDYNLLPFSSFSELRTVQLRAPRFMRRKYPQDMKNEKLHGSLAELGVNIHYYALWCFAAPIVLLFQSFPLKKSITHVSSV